jgi:hypothetical protein
VSADGREHFRQHAALFRWTGAGPSWFFLRLSGEVAEAIAALALMRRLESGRRRGWGGLKVEAQIADTRWPSMIMPNGKGGWLLPVKKSVREAVGLREGDETVIELWV